MRIQEALLPPIGLALQEGVFQHSVQLYSTQYFLPSSHAAPHLLYFH
jgi:hypothetical protein